MSQGRYVWIAGKKVYLNSELQKEWDKLINKERYRLHQMLKYIREHRSTFCDFRCGIISGFDASSACA